MTDRASQVLVLGAGVVGLTTALRLQQAGWQVRIWARDRPEATTSAVAAAVWTPFAAAPRDQVLAWSQASYDAFVALAAAADCPVSMVAGIEFVRDSAEPPWWHGIGPELTADPQAAAARGHAMAWRFAVPLAPMPEYLHWLCDRLAAGGTTIETVDLTTLDTALDACANVVQCTGLGARALCGDDDLVGARGQVVTVPAGVAEAFVFDDADPARPVYVIPRAEDVVLGGTYEPGREDLTPDPEQTQAILAQCAPHLNRPVGVEAVLQTKVGLRPYRPRIRLVRTEPSAGTVLIHNYGHGGSGMTLSWGCADEVCTLLGAPRTR